MAQKTNPISLRLQHTNRFFDNNWYSKKHYDKLVIKDIHIQKYINIFLKLLKLPSSRVSIQHIPQKTRMFSFFCYPKISRSIRSKMFGIYVPHFFKQQNKWISQNKKYNSNFLATKSKIKDFKNILTTTKLLYNNDLINNSLLNLIGTFKTYSCTNKLAKREFNGKNEKWLKNLFFVNHYLKIMKADSDKNSNKLTVSKSPELKSQKLSCNSENYNKVFLKFIINLVVQNKFKKKSSEGNKGIKNFKLKNLEMKTLLKYFLIINNFQKNIYSLKSQISSARHSNFKLSNILNNYSKINYSFLSNKDTTSNKIFVDHSIGSNILKPDNSILAVDPQHSNEIINIKSNKQTIKTTIQDILEILPEKKISLVNKNLLSDYNFTHSLYLFENKPLLKIENIWKLNTIENNYKYKNYIQRSLAGIYNLDFEFIPFKIKNDWQNAGFLADEIAYFLERRVPFRRFKNKLLNYISKNSNIRGIRITCSGRVGGKSKKAQRAKTECVKLGQTSLHVFSNQIDFAIRTAHTSFGSVGIKVWISYNS